MRAVPSEIEHLLREWWKHTSQGEYHKEQSDAHLKLAYEWRERAAAVRQKLWCQEQEVGVPKEGTQWHYLLEERNVGQVVYIVTQRSGHVEVQRVVPCQ